MGVSANKSALQATVCLASPQCVGRWCLQAPNVMLGQILAAANFKDIVQPMTTQGISHYFVGSNQQYGSCVEVYAPLLANLLGGTSNGTWPSNKKSLMQPGTCPKPFNAPANEDPTMGRDGRWGILTQGSYYTNPLGEMAQPP